MRQTSKQVIPAFAYFRVSGTSQVTGDGFPRQKLAVEKYAAANGIQIVRMFEEKAVTGSKETLDRPAFMSLMSALHADGVRTVIIEKLDRLARNLMIQEACIADLRKHGFELISVHEPDLCSDDPTRILTRQLLGAVAQYEKSQIVAKLRGARLRKKAATGRCEGRKPYGFYDGEPAVIERMKALRTSGSTYQEISDTLNKADVLPRHTGKWHPGYVHRILSR